MTSGKSVLRRPMVSKSNIELINSLRAHFSAHAASPSIQSQTKSSSNCSVIPPWTTQKYDTLYIPSYHSTPLAEPRESYDITCKLFFLPGIPSSRRCVHIHQAIDLVLAELGVSNVDLLIVSYPGVSFDADDDEGEESSVTEDDSAGSDESQGFEAQIRTWKTLETLQEKGTIGQLGVSEFSSDRLAKFLPELKIKPSVDQINVKDCCVVPEPLIRYAKENQIELLTHNDCTDILPCGTTRELLGPGEKGAGILAVTADAPESEPGLKGDIEPQWVIKYTAVVKNRGVIENKGYFAVAQAGSCIEPKAVTAC